MAYELGLLLLGVIPNVRHPTICILQLHVPSRKGKRAPSAKAQPQARIIHGKGKSKNQHGAWWGGMARHSA